MGTKLKKIPKLNFIPKYPIILIVTYYNNEVAMRVFTFLIFACFSFSSFSGSVDELGTNPNFDWKKCNDCKAKKIKNESKRAKRKRCARYCEAYFKVQNASIGETDSLDCMDSTNSISDPFPGTIHGKGNPNYDVTKCSGIRGGTPDIGSSDDEPTTDGDQLPNPGSGGDDI